MTEKIDSGRRWALVAAFAVGAIVTLIAGLTWPLLSIRLEAAGHGGSAIGLSTAAQTAAMVAIAPLIPPVAGRIGAIRLMGLGVVIGIAVLLLMAVWQTYASWLVLRFLLGVCYEILFIMSDAWVIQLAPEAKRGRVMGLYTSTSLIGFAAGPMVIDIVGTAGFAPFLVGAAIIALAAAPLYLARRNGPRAEGRPAQGFLGFIRATPTIMLAGAMYGFIDVVFLALFPVYALHSGLDEASIARLISTAILGAIACQYGIGWLCDRLAPRTVLIGCTSMALACALALPFAIGSTVLTVPLLVLWVAALDGFFTIGMVMMGRRYKDIDLLAANTVFVVMFGAGSTVGPTLGGAAMDAWDPHGMIAIVAAACLAFLPFALRRGYDQPPAP